MRIDDATIAKPVTLILRPSKTPDGADVTPVQRHGLRAIRARGPSVDILGCGDSHYGGHEAMRWCERNRIGYVFSMADSTSLLGRVTDLAEDAAVGWIAGEADRVRLSTSSTTPPAPRSSSAG